jgi:8-oxo-dGTP pyrophosphatase MutT (NUDIX family)
MDPERDQGAIVPRPAATVIVVRADGDGRLQFLVLRRSAASRFAPGFVVFPGGVVEEGDAQLGSDWFGGHDEAARACALRELAEETGLVMTRDGLKEAPGHLPGEPGLPPPPVDSVPEIARWVAPEFLPVRFDAKFFALHADSPVEPTPDGIETDRGWWAGAGEILDAQRTGDAQLMWPTMKTLETLADCRSVDDVLTLKMEQVPPPVPSS